MNTIKFFISALLISACATTDEMPPPVQEEAPRCWYSGGYQYKEASQACHEANFDSVAIHCDEGAELTNCDFAVDLPGGGFTYCRIGWPVCKMPGQE